MRLKTSVRSVKSREKGTPFGVALEDGKGAKGKRLTLTRIRGLRRRILHLRAEE